MMKKQLEQLEKKLLENKDSLTMQPSGVDLVLTTAIFCLWKEVAELKKLQLEKSERKNKVGF